MPTKKHVDLQMHSIYSDGDYTPAQVVNFLKKYNIKVAALTDHDTIKGIPEFISACRQAKIKPITGIELYVRYKRHYLHLLGYNIDINNRFLQQELVKVHRRKYNLLKKITPLLKKKKIIVNPEKLLRQPAEYIGMNNLLREIEADPKNVRQIQRCLGKKQYEHWEVIYKYFSHGHNTHYPEIFVPIELGLKMIRQSGGVPILAHPGQQLRFEDDQVIKELCRLGLKGIECFSSHHKYSQVAHYLRLAHQCKIIPTGGSDFHGDLEKHLLIQRLWDYTLLPYQLYRNIKVF